MRKIKEVLRLHAVCRVSGRAIALDLGIGPATVSGYLARARLANLSWPLPPGLDDAMLERRLFPPPEEAPSQRIVPDCNSIHAGLRRAGVTLQLLWEEYKTKSGDEGFQYSGFCAHYRQWVAVDITMRQRHRASKILFVDYAGGTVPITDPATGEMRKAQVFVAVLGASSDTYAEATWTQNSLDWVGSHVRAFASFGGAPMLLVPDNLRSGVSRACRYNPDIAPAYYEMARHRVALVENQPLGGRSSTT